MAEAIRRDRRSSALVGGFTLVELVMVIVIIGVLAVAVVPRFMDRSVFETRGFHDETLSLLRYAQKAAIAQRRAVCVTLGGTGVSMAMVSAPASTDCSATTSLALPNPNPKGGSGLTATVGGFVFLPAGGTNQATNVSISFPDGPGITVEAVTGYVH